MATTRFADHLLTGTHASRPAASAVPAGTLYSCTTHSLIYQSDGTSAWSTYATLGSTETLPASIIDAKGDLIAGTANDTAARLAVGSDGQVLTADSASTPGVKWDAAGGGGAWTLLSTTTRGSLGTIDVSTRGDNAASTDSIALQLNGDTAANYYREAVEVSGTGAISGSENIGASNVQCGRIPGNTAAASLFGVTEIILFGYASTTWKKSVVWQSFGNHAITTGNVVYRAGGAHWNNTAAITRVTLFGAATANLAIGSTCRIYGRL